MARERAGLVTPHVCQFLLSVGNGTCTVPFSLHLFQEICLQFAFNGPKTEHSVSFRKEMVSVRYATQGVLQDPAFFPHHLDEGIFGNRGNNGRRYGVNVDRKPVVSSKKESGSNSPGRCNIFYNHLNSFGIGHLGPQHPLVHNEQRFINVTLHGNKFTRGIVSQAALSVQHSIYLIPFNP